MRRSGDGELGLWYVADTLTLGQIRRLVVATQLICCSSLLVLHDVLEAIPEADCLAIMRAIHQHAM